MNANELADFVEISKPDDKTHQTIATMLRQQQAEIEALKAKTLTDEEILEVAKEMGWRGALGFLIRFARAILKKAQEK